jgi:hypothetical protein
MNEDRQKMPHRPYRLPDLLREEEIGILTYWNRLKRGNADIPFADDVRLSEMERFADGVFLIHVFERPLRLRFEIVGGDIKGSYGGDLAGVFADELPVRCPLNYLLSQCHATIEARAPSFYENAPNEAGLEGFRRLVVPLWADGHIAALLGLVTGLKK